MVTFFIVCYGAFTVPVYWLKQYSLADFNSLIALYVIFGVLTFILIALLNIYIPYCMREAEEKAVAVSPRAGSPTSDEDEIPIRRVAQKYGFSMSIFGTLANFLSATLMLVIVIIISRTLPGPNGQSAGLLVTTIIGFVTMVASLVSYLGLPALPAKSYPASGGWKTVLLELLTPYREMLLRKKNMLFLLLAYTMYTDTLFALATITSQLYFIELKPDTLEYSLYSLAQNLYSLVLTLTFYLLQLRFKWNLGKCLIFGYALILVVPVWGCVGLAKNVDFGFKASKDSCQPFQSSSLSRHSISFLPSRFDCANVHRPESLGILRATAYQQHLTIRRQSNFPTPVLRFGT